MENLFFKHELIPSAIISLVEPSYIAHVMSFRKTHILYRQRRQIGDFKCATKETYHHEKKINQQPYYVGKHH